MKPNIITKAERIQQGKVLREKCSRSTHAKFEPRSSSIDPIKLLEDTNVDRIPGLIAIRYQRMSESTFKFFRGTSIIQARDLEHSPVSGIHVQLCGDCHLMNFGGFASAERNMVFDINDFDETFPGPWEWDIKRLVVSMELAARDLDFSKNVAENAVRAAVASYREHMSEFADQTVLQRWYTQITVENLLEFFKKDKQMIDRLKSAQPKALSKTSEAIFPKLTEAVKGNTRIKEDPPLIYHVQNLDINKLAQTSLEDYRKSLQTDRQHLLERFHFQDAAVKVVGVGSVGLRCYVSLFLADEDDPLFLQVKEARRSVLEPTFGKSLFEHQGHRVVHGQHLMQASSDIFLGWYRNFNGRDFYVRQLRDMKVSPEVETFNPRTLTAYATVCGWALARAHAKAGEVEMIAGYLGTKENFDDAMVQYSIAYADQVERDFKVFKAAINSGRLKTKVGSPKTLEFDL
ncbi:DUF2252 domain-containing protein [Candidatus Nitrosotalea bavarica]|uniref:DUF2252 domain-containing protein n=1 Tax=Candidatus Nitrosotalea bavarica TaxID=1903277 RepID=UPI000C7043B8|nr:DUF2252 domain-containing protein [Candidatus Nitrosotalea bavarica]